MSPMRCFQLLVDVRRGLNELSSNYSLAVEGLVMQEIFKSVLSKRCSRIKLYDVDKRPYNVYVEQCGGSEVKLRHGDWARFVNSCIEPDTTKLCFKLIEKDTFEVFVFDSDYGQNSTDVDGYFTNQKCLIEATDETMTEQYLPLGFLEDLYGTSIVKPFDSVDVYGFKQNGTVDIIYEFEEHLDSEDEFDEEGEVVPKVYWHAVGFSGSQWSNICMVNNIIGGHTMMFTNPKDGTYLVDVFTAEGVGLGVAALKNAQLLSKCQSDDEDGVKPMKHKCRVRAHGHDLHKPCFLTVFPYRTLATKLLTLSKSIVRPYNFANPSFGQHQVWDIVFSRNVAP